MYLVSSWLSIVYRFSTPPSCVSADLSHPYLSNLQTRDLGPVCHNGFLRPAYILPCHAHGDALAAAVRSLPAWVAVDTTVIATAKVLHAPFSPLICAQLSRARRLPAPQAKRVFLPIRHWPASPTMVALDIVLPGFFLLHDPITGRYPFKRRFFAHTEAATLAKRASGQVCVFPRKWHSSSLLIARNAQPSPPPPF